MSVTSGTVQSFYFLQQDGAKFCTINETCKVVSRPFYIIVSNFGSTVMKGNSVVGHHIGLNQMHTDRSSCLNSSAIVLMSVQC